MKKISVIDNTKIEFQETFNVEEYFDTASSFLDQILKGNIQKDNKLTMCIGEPIYNHLEWYNEIKKRKAIK